MSDEDVIPRPEWMSEGFLVECLKAADNLHEGAHVKVGKVSLSYVVPKGENFMGVIYRAVIKYELDMDLDNNRKTETKRHENEPPKGLCDKLKAAAFVMKVAQVREDMSEMIQNIFLREIDMYKNIAPKLLEILELKNLPTNIFCRYIHSLENQPKVLVLEDLKPQGYTMANRLEGFDLEHAKLALGKLAIFHAVSMCYIAGQGEYVKEAYSQTKFESMANNDSQKLQLILRVGNKKIEEVIKDLTEAGQREKTVEFLKGFIELLHKKQLNKSPRIPGSKFNALNHTDCWQNNIMFKYGENGSLEDCLYVDLQGCHYTTVAYDFNVLFFTCANMDVRLNGFEELRDFYHSALAENLKLLNHDGDIPTLEEFKEELKRTVATALITVFFMIPVILKEHDSETKSRQKSEAFSFREMIEMIEDAGSGSLIKDTISASMDVMLQQGYFDRWPGSIETS